MKRNLKVQPSVPLNREQRIANCMEQLRDEIARDLRMAQSDLDKWSVRFTENAADAVDYSRVAFESAAKKEIAQQITGMVQNIRTNADDYEGVTDFQIIEILRTEFYEAVLRGARYPSHSSSPTSIVIERNRLQCRAEWLGRFDDMVGYIKRAEG